MRRHRPPLNALTLAASLLMQPASAATVTWDGGGPGANWSALDAKPGPNFGRTNWSGTNIFPGLGDDLVFDGINRLASTNDIAALASIGSLSFAAGAGAFTLGGSGFALTGNLVNLSKARQTINLPLAVAGSGQSWDGGLAGVAISGAFTLGDRSLSLNHGIAIVDTSSQLVVGDLGLGALTLASGSSSSTHSVSIGRQRGGDGSIVVDGAGSSLNAAAGLMVAGEGGFGSLTIQGGGTASAGSLSVSASGRSTGPGMVTVSGAGSKLTTGAIQLAHTGFARMTVNDGASLASASASLAGRDGQMLVDGIGTRWTNDGTLGLGDGIKLDITGGAIVDSGNVALTGSGGGDLSLSGAGSQLTSRGAFTLDAGGGHLSVGGGAFLDTASASVAGNLALATVQGSGTRWSAGSLLQIGESAGAGATLRILPGGEVSATTVSLGTNGVIELAGGTLRTDTFAVRGAFNWSAGVLNLTAPGGVVLGGPASPWPSALTMAAGTTLQVTQDLSLVNTTLRVADGALVTAARTTIGSNATFELAGGTLQTEALTPQGAFNWTAGTLRLTGSDGATLGATGGPLARVTTLQAGRRLEVTNELRVGSGALLVLDGGRAVAGNLVLDAGTVVALQPVDLADFGAVKGRGSLNAALHGGAGTRIQAGGPLSMGDLASAEGFLFDGRLEVGSNQVLLQSATLATPGSVVTLGAGGQLAAVNGLWLAAGRRLEFSGSASVLGGFVNDGLVSGSDGTLTFLNDVSGSGSFAGDIVFHAGFSPGHSAARVDFGGGDARFDGSAVLTLELSGSGYDQLADIDVLSFNGRLQLVFDAGFKPATGTRFALFDFDAFAGSLSADRIEISGFDRARLDFSQLARNGTLSVTPVPEPAAALLWLAGLAVLPGALAVRRARRAASG